MMLLLAFAETSIQLVPDGTLLVHVFLIVLMVVVLNKTLFKPINQVLEERDRHTRGALSEARRLLEKIDRGLRGYEQSLAAARSEGYRLLEIQRSEAMRERESRLVAARDEVVRLMEVERAAIEAQSQAARELLNEEAKKLGLRISAQILRHLV